MHEPLQPHIPRYPALDGLRGVAIIPVLLIHTLTLHNTTGIVGALTRISAFGFLGVDLFFVLSSFLITTILLNTDPTPRQACRFYLRRMLRTWPLFYPCLFLAFTLFPLTVTYASADLNHAIHFRWWYYLHACNFLFAWQRSWMTGILNHFWSLAVEEQFYLFWPLVVLPLRGKLLPWALALMIPGACLARLYFFHVDAGYLRIRVPTFCNLDSLALGALVALLTRTVGPVKLRPAAWFTLCISGTFSIIAANLRIFDEDAFRVFILPLVLLSMSAALYLLLSPSRLATHIFARGPLPALGRYSYGLYVLHVFLRPAFERLTGTPQQLALRFHSRNLGSGIYALEIITLSFAAAGASYHLWEKRWLRLKRRFE